MFRTEFCEVSYIERLNIVFVKWNKFCSGYDYREPLLYALGVLKANNECNFVVDATDGFENENVDNVWLKNEYIPHAAAESSCKNIFFIIDNDNNLKDEIENHTSILSKYFKVYICHNLVEVSQIILRNKLYELELQPMMPEIRESKTKMREVLAEDFFEYCSSGNIYYFCKDNFDTKDPIIFDAEIKDFDIKILASDVVLATYKAIKHHETREDMKYSLRSSIWKNIDGQWKIVFHQGTNINRYKNKYG